MTTIGAEPPQGAVELAERFVAIVSAVSWLGIVVGLVALLSVVVVGTGYALRDRRRFE